MFRDRSCLTGGTRQNRIEMARVPEISLANKSQLLFGVAAVIIITCVLAIPWIRTGEMVSEYQLELSRQIAGAWLTDRIELSGRSPVGQTPRPIAELFDEEQETSGAMRMTFVRISEIDADNEEHRFPADAMARFESDASEREFTATEQFGGKAVFRYARPLRESDMRALRDSSVTSFTGRIFEPGVVNPLRAMLIVDVTSEFADRQLLVNRMFIAIAGLVGSLLAILVFYFILTKLILRPVRKLRDTVDRIQEGNMKIRSEIQTGDEFQQLSEAFNEMLDRLVSTQDKLRSMNESLDLKVSELAEANVGLYDLNKYKSEFVANVSHELRTPLNSIIGFAELLEEVARTEPTPDEKRLRYLGNILTSGRRLLEMINELLDMAKIEAGRMEVLIDSTSVADLIEGLVGIMGPQATQKHIEITTHVAENTPMVETDPGKLQQIVYNFLSNAIKFSPEGGSVAITAERIGRQDQRGAVRISVRDSGPGIPEDMRDAIFEKFRQIEQSHTRQHAGTGLGLAICRELAEMLGATVSYTSQSGAGATFFVDLPVEYRTAEPKPLMAS